MRTGGRQARPTNRPDKPIAAIERAWTIPNGLTCLRLLLVAPFVLFYESGAIAAASVTFAVAALSDGLDGFLARRLGQQSRLGALLDPVGDKVLIFAALVVLVVSGALPLWLLIASLLRDGVVLIIALVCLVRRCPTERDPMRLGKLATLCTNATVLLALAHTLWPLAFLTSLLQAFCALAATCLCLAAIGYAARALGAKFAPTPPLAKSDACRERRQT